MPKYGKMGAIFELTVGHSELRTITQIPDTAESYEMFHIWSWVQCVAKYSAVE